MASKSSRLRTGYTTGACAAAAAKAAVMRLLAELDAKGRSVDIPFPDGSRHSFRIHTSAYDMQEKSALASIIKDAGDDPDITHKAEIQAEARILKVTAQGPNDGSACTSDHPRIVIKGGRGVGIVTKPGLSVPAGEPAINPVPRRMIREAVTEAVRESGYPDSTMLEITVSVPEGKKLSKKTLNARLGIIGGISILGTSGIVRPVSSEAWTATVTASMDVAKAAGHQTVVLSAGRSSEKAHIRRYSLPEEMYVMMGDYLEFSLRETVAHGFQRVHLCAQWAKMLKIAMATPQTHVRHGAIDMDRTVAFLEGLWRLPLGADHKFNTAMELLQFVDSSFISVRPGLLLRVCQAAKSYAETITKEIPVTCHLVSYEGEVIAESE